MALSEVNALTRERPKHSNIEAESNPTEKLLYEDDRSLKIKNENWLSVGRLTLTEEWIEVGWGVVDLRERRVKL